MKKLLFLLFFVSAFSYSQLEKEVVTTNRYMYQLDSNGDLKDLTKLKSATHFIINQSSIIINSPNQKTPEIFTVVNSTIKNDGNKVKFSAIDNQYNNVFKMVIYNKGVIIISSEKHISIYHKMNEDEFNYFMEYEL